MHKDCFNDDNILCIDEEVIVVKGIGRLIYLVMIKGKRKGETFLFLVVLSTLSAIHGSKCGGLWK